MSSGDVEPPTGIARFGATTFTSALVGAMVGTVEAMWTDTPAVKAEKSGPAIRATAACVVRNATLFGFVGAAYTGVDLLASSMREKSDIWNGIYGGIAAGQMISLKTGSFVRGAGASALFAGISAAVDLSDQSLQPERWTDAKRTFNYGHTAKLE